MYAPGYGTIVPPMVSVFNWQIGWMDEAHQGTPPASSTWELVERGAFHPIILPATCVVRRLWWANGSTVSASYNIDCAIFRDAGYKPRDRVVSTGSTAQGTANQIQFVDVTDTVLTPGLWWLALSCDSASATFLRCLINTSYDGAHRFQVSSAIPWDATETPVETTADQFYVFGFATTASP